ncbi:facilitated trehalose transporter Tret1-2 homolog [Frankliniella occidentalis]|uniref:Facilitated trehalose transporter Tret1-2 homolog n=1 Tax=Frankliniella occidentalis TaxID=133901 RepID=A0A9C6WSS4_FRAOC|nr:facilitated trehalose transporter Tret1-2 homolog [Frankliniella occidentalis]
MAARGSTVRVNAGTRFTHCSQVLAALAVSLGPFAAGLGKGYSSPAIASLQEQQRVPLDPGGAAGAVGGGGGTSAGFTVSPQQASWVASLSLLGALFGGLLGGMAMRYGRRKVLLVTAVPFSASWLVTVFATSVEMMFVTAFVGGFCCSIVLLVTQVYVSEIAGPDIRGCLSAVLKMVGQVGVLLSFLGGAYLDWRQLALVVAVAPIMLFVSVLYVPETPSYLVLAGKDDEAARALQWLRGPDTDVGPELAVIRSNILCASGMDDSTPPRSPASFMTHSHRMLRPALTTCGLMLFQRFSGAQAFQFYAVPIFRQTFGGMSPHGGAIAVAFVQLLASLLSGLLIDTVGRLPLLIASSVFMSMALAGFGSFAYYMDAQGDRGAALGGSQDWIPLLCVLVFTVAFSLGISPISWLLISELFPLQYRGAGSSLATSFSYACAFVGVKTFVDFQQALGLHGAFWLYAAISVCGLCFVVCCVPETKGRDLDEMSPRWNTAASAPTATAAAGVRVQPPPPHMAPNVDHGGHLGHMGMGHLGMGHTTGHHHHMGLGPPLGPPGGA